MSANSRWNRVKGAVGDSGAPKRKIAVVHAAFRTCAEWKGYFGALTSPDNSNSTLTTCFTFSRKLLGSLMPHNT